MENKVEKLKPKFKCHVCKECSCVCETMSCISEFLRQFEKLLLDYEQKLRPKH